jgi:hypothetical protein
MIDRMPPARQDMPTGHQTARRAHLLSEMATPHRHRPVRRVMIGGLLTTGLAGGVAAALIVVPDGGTGGGGGPEPATVTPMSAVQVLDRAAETAGHGIAPRPGQYVYTETESKGMAWYRGGAVTREKKWWSVSGKRINLLVDPGGRHWQCEALHPMPQEEVTPAKAPADCKNQPYMRSGLPTDANTMKAWLYDNAKGAVLPPDVRAFSYVHEMIAGWGVRPAAQAAMFKAAAMLPGVKVSHVGTDFIAVGQTYRDIRRELLFEPKTYRFVGTRMAVDHDRSFQPKGGMPEGNRPGGGKGEHPNVATGKKHGTFLGQNLIVDQKVVDTIPVKYLK